jgi:putative membrane protein
MRQSIYGRGHIFGRVIPARTRPRLAVLGACTSAGGGRRRTYARAMREFAIRWVGNVVALFVAAWILSGISYGDQWWTLFIAAAVFTLINAWVKPVLTILSLPFIVVTLGLFYFLINVLMLYVTDWVVPDFEIRSFWWAVLGAIIVSLVNGLMNLVLPDRDERSRAAR